MLHCHQAWGDKGEKNTVAFFCMVKNAAAIKSNAVAFNLFKFMVGKKQML